MEDLYRLQKQRPLVVVVDEDPGFLEWVESALHHQGVDCCCASTPARAIEAACTARPDVIFVDADAPQLLVSDTLALLKSHGATANAPIYLLTGMRNFRLSNGANGIAGYLHKPFLISDMMEIIAQRV